MTVATDEGWEEIAVPRGAYIGWGEKPGQTVFGEVIEYGDTTGSDFDGNKCPQVSLVLMADAPTHSKQDGWSVIKSGEMAVINCGQASLKRAVQAGQLRPGDLMRLVMESIEPLKGGKTVKVFGLKVKRGTGSLSANAQEVLTKNAAKQEAAAAAGDGWGNANEEPPF